MRLIPRRADTELEGPFRTPEQLALAMPLVAMIGLMVVVSAVATGGSRTMVALVAGGGFGLCAIAPMALIDVYVTRPLRAALAQMRAARDGRPSEAVFASGIVADVVHLARDIRAAQANLGPTGEVAAQCEKMIAAGEDAVRALRLQTETLAAAPRDSRQEPAAQAEIVALAEAMKLLRAAPAAGLDGAVERLEAMLVYIAEALDRIEAKDRQIEGGVGQVGQGVADLARLVARETEILQGEMSSGGLHVRADIAGVVAEEKLGRTRLMERLDALETRLVARAPQPDARLAADLRALVETMARHARDLAPGAIVEALRAQGIAAAPAGEQLTRLADAVSRLAEGASAAPGRIVEALRADLQPVAAELSHRIDALMTRLDVTGRDDPHAVVALAAPARLSDEVVDPLREMLGEAQARMTGGLADLAARLEAALGAQSERFDAFEIRALAPACGALAGAAEHFVAAQARIEQVAAKMEAGDPRFARLGDLAANAESLAPAREALAEAAQRFEAAQARGAHAAAEIEAGESRLAATAEALGALAHILPEVSRDLGETQARWRGLVGDFETTTQHLSALATTDARDIEGLRADFSVAGETLRAGVARFEAEAGAQADRLTQAVAAQNREAVAALSQAMRGLAEANRRIEAAVAEHALAPAVQEALDALRADFAATAAAAAEKFDSAAQDLTRTVEDRVERLRRGELRPAIVAAQATAQELHTAHAGLFTHVEALKAALIAERSGFAALRLDVVEAFAKVAAIGERADASMREAAIRADALSVRVADLGAAGMAQRGRGVVDAIEENTARRDGLERRWEEAAAALTFATAAVDAEARARSGDALTVAA